MKSKMLKRIIASLMCVGMLLSMIPMMSISAAYDYSDVVEKTTALNIIPEKIDAEDFVTRKELAKFMYYMLNVKENGAVYGTPEFSDIDKTSEYYEYVSVMTGSRLMIGISDTQFAPDMKVTFGMVARVLLNATGYYQLAREGTMESFTNVAASLGILKNVAYDANSEVLMGELAQMIWNVMQLKAVETTIQGESKYVVADTNLLWHYHKIADSKGKVTANEDTALNRAVGTDEGCVVINDVVYRAGTDYIKNMIGKNVRFYYKSHEDFDEPIVMWAELTSDKQLIFDATEIKTVIGTSFTTEIDNKEKVYSLSSVVNVIFNGKYRPFDARDLMPVIGNVELVDADEDRVYELAIVKSYIPYIVKSVDAKDNIIYDKTGKSRIQIDDEAVYSMTQNGKAVALESFEGNEVLLVAADKTVYDINNVMSVDSANSRIYEILVSTEIIAGVADEINIGEGYAMINGEKYDIRATIDYAGNTSVEIGKEQIFYIDTFSNVVYAENAVTESGATVKGTYAFVTKTKYDNFEDKTTIRCFDTNGNWNNYGFAEKARIDGATYRNQSTMYDALTGTGIFLASDKATGRLETNAPNGTEYAYLAVLRFNNDGKITFIDTPYVNTNETEENSLYLNYYRINNREMEIGVDAAEKSNTSQNYIFQHTWNDKYYIPEVFPLIQIPIDKATNKVMVQEEEERHFVSRELKGGNIIPNFEGMVFNAGEERSPEFAVWTQGFNSTGGRIDNDIRSNVITKITDSVNDDNEPIKRIFVTGPDGMRTLDIVYSKDSSGNITSKTPINEEKDPINTSDTYTNGVRTISLSDLRKGDVIAYETSGSQVLGITRRFAFYLPDGSVNTSYNLSYNSNTRYSESTPSISWGKLYLASDSSVQLYATNINSRGVYNLAGASIYCYDLETEEFKTVELNELRDYVGMGGEAGADRILITRRHSKGADAMVFRNVR